MFFCTCAREKVIQYIELIKADDGTESSASGTPPASYTSSKGEQYPFVDGESFSVEDGLAHGQHVAGTIAGSTLNDPAEVATCSDGEVLGCGGGCIPPDAPAEDADSGDVNPDSDEDIDRMCPMYDCVGAEEAQQCLGDDVSATLSEHGGMARGAKIAVMDIFMGKYSYADLAGNGVWEACLDAGCKIHSNSYGVDKRCEVDSLDLVYDDFMYSNQENLLLFAAGNEGWFTDRDGLCTVNSPGIAKVRAARTLVGRCTCVAPRQCPVSGVMYGATLWAFSSITRSVVCIDSTYPLSACTYCFIVSICCNCILSLKYW